MQEKAVILLIDAFGGVCTFPAQPAFPLSLKSQSVLGKFAGTASIFLNVILCDNAMVAFYTQFLTI